MLSLKKIWAVKIASVVLSFMLWIPMLHYFYAPDLNEYLSANGISSKARMMAEWHLKVWRDPELRRLEIDKMHGASAEWDFMGRTFFVLSLANIALRDEMLKDDAILAMDAIIDETIRLDRENGLYFFLLPYGEAKRDDWRQKPERSMFVDGEIALMIATRRLVSEREDYKVELGKRIDLIYSRMNESPALSCESYPDECWLFCNSIAVAAIRMSDVLDGTDHEDFICRWIENIRTVLMHKETGMAIAAYYYDGSPHPFGKTPEGSTMWLFAHMMQLVDEQFAREQYVASKKYLADSVCGFGYAKEWAEGYETAWDIDSGPIVPILDASAASSGLALLGAASFDDREYYSLLLTSLNFEGFPEERDGMLRYHASNQVGDAVLLYSMVQGPLWDLVKGRAAGGK